MSEEGFYGCRAGGNERLNAALMMILADVFEVQ